MGTFICYILLLINNLERYDTEIQLDIKHDKNDDVIVKKTDYSQIQGQIEAQEKDDIEQKRKKADYVRMQQLRITQEATKKDGIIKINRIN
jgi:hypothetical protein